MLGMVGTYLCAQHQLLVYRWTDFLTGLLMNFSIKEEVLDLLSHRIVQQNQDIVSRFLTT